MSVVIKDLIYTIFFLLSLYFIVYPALKDLYGIVRIFLFSSWYAKCEGVVTNLSALSESGLYNVRISYLGVESVVRYKHFKPEAPFESGERVRVFYRKCDKKLRFIASNQTDGDSNLPYASGAPVSSGFDDRNASAGESSPLQANAVFRVAALSPKFEKGINTYDITGEVIGEGSAGESITVEKVILPIFLRSVVPGMVVPCQVDKSTGKTEIVFILQS